MNNLTTEYKGFTHTAAELSAYARTLDVFVISLRNGQIVHYSPEDIAAFEAWLAAHRIRNINAPQ